QAPFRGPQPPGGAVGVQRQILEPQPEGYAIFVHDKLHEVVYDRIIPDVRPQLHRRVAEALEKEPAQMGVVAWHWTEAGQPERARECFIKAAHHAAARWALSDAQRHFLSALELFEPGEAPDVRIDFVEMVLSKGTEYDLLETQVRQALEALHPHNNDVETLRLQARAHVAWGEMLSRFGSNRHDEARRQIDQGLELANAQGNIGLRARALRAMGMLEVHQHDWSPGACERAMACYQRALVLWQVLRDPVQEASIIFAMGSLHSNLNHRDDALDCYQRALTLQQANGDRKGECVTQFDLGWLYTNEGRYTEAIRYYTAAQEGLRSIGARLSEASVLNNIGLLYSFRCDYRKALEMYTAGLKIHQQLQSGSAAFVQINIAMMHAFLGDFDQSMSWAQKVMDQLDQEREERRVPIRVLVCWMERLRGNLDAVLRLSRQGLQDLDPSTFTGMHYSGLYGRMLAYALCLRGELDLAQEAGEKAVKAEIADKAVLGLIDARADLIRVYIAQGNDAQAQELLFEQFEHLGQYPDDFDDSRAQTHFLRAQLHHRRGQLEAAQEDLDIALELSLGTGCRVNVALFLCAQGMLAHVRKRDVMVWWNRAKREVDALAL
ncbi:MAG: tetratricopeptide repeat protein, partial [Myxococcota bacterium]